MTQDEFIGIVKRPETVSSHHIDGLKEMVEYYPYFVQARLLLAKAEHDAKSLHAKKYIDAAALYCSDRRWLFYYLFPEKNIGQEYKVDRVPKFGGNYFDLINAVEAEGGDTRQSLKNLAERLKSARAMVTVSAEASKATAEKQPQRNESVHIPVPDYFGNKLNHQDKSAEISEENVRTLVHEKKYSEAIEILNKLNLINPKKSIYFADQIRFLEKALVNSKK